MSSKNFTKWDRRYLDVAKLIGSWTSCYRHDVGAVIVKDNRIIATGYNGAPTGIDSCKSCGKCYKQVQGIDRGYTYCKAIHAEENAILQAAKMGATVAGSTLYCTHMPCSMCTKSIMNSGIKKVIYLEDYEDDWAKDLQKQNSDIVFIQYIEEEKDASTNNKD